MKRSITRLRRGCISICIGCHTHVTKSCTSSESWTPQPRDWWGKHSQFVLSTSDNQGCLCKSFIQSRAFRSYNRSEFYCCNCHNVWNSCTDQMWMMLQLCSFSIPYPESALYVRQGYTVSLPYRRQYRVSSIYRNLTGVESSFLGMYFLREWILHLHIAHCIDTCMLSRSAHPVMRKYKREVMYHGSLDLAAHHTFTLCDSMAGTSVHQSSRTS